LALFLKLPRDYAGSQALALGHEGLAPFWDKGLKPAVNECSPSQALTRPKPLLNQSTPRRDK